MSRKKDITYFADETTYHLWLKQVEEERQNLISQIRKKMAARKEFRAEGGDIVYLDDEKKQVHIIHSNGDLQIEEQAQAYSANGRNAAVLYTDGSVKVSGADNEHGQKNTDDWKGIAQILEGLNCTYGVTENGDIVYAGSAQADVPNWKNIKKLFAGKNRIAGLDQNGKIKVSDYGEEGRSGFMEEPDNWSDITEVALSGDCIVGLLENGKVLFCGKQEDARRQAEEWSDIVSLAADNYFVYGLTEHGQVKVAGTCLPYLDRGRSSVSQWAEQEQIVILAAGSSGVAAVTEHGELKLAGTMGDADAVCECWNREIRPMITERISGTQEA